MPAPTTRTAALAAGLALLATASGVAASPSAPSLLASRADSGPWDAVSSAARDLGARLAASAASWRQTMAVPSRSQYKNAAGGAEEESLAFTADGGLAASLDITYGDAREAPGAVLAEIADWVASLGEVNEEGAGARPSPSVAAAAAEVRAGRAAAAADVAGLLDGVAGRFEAALASAGAGDAEVAYDVNIQVRRERREREERGEEKGGGGGGGGTGCVVLSSHQSHSHLSLLRPTPALSFFSSAPTLPPPPSTWM